MTLSAALMAHPSRKPFVDELLPRLDRDIEIVWDRRNDRWDTGRRSMLAHDPAASHHLVLQEDAVPCRDLIAGIEQACGAGHDGPLAFYVGHSRPQVIQHQAPALIRQAQRSGSVWMRMEGPWWGVAIAVPTAHIADMLAWCDARPDIHNYDKRIARFYASQGIDCWYSVPSLVDHRHVGENPSLVPGRTGNRQAHLFIGADRSALDIDWNRPPEGDHLMATHRNTKTGNTIDVVPGSALAKAVEKDPDWEGVDREAIAASDETAKSIKREKTKGDDETILSRDALNARAEALGVENAAGYSTDDELKDAIQAVVDDAGAGGKVTDELTREQLDIRAIAVGVEDPDTLANKGAVIEAIEAVEGQDRAEA